LSQGEISRRLSEVRQGEAHLRNELDPASPHNAILRFRDVTRYIGLRENEVWLWFPDMWRSKHRLVTRPAPKKAVALPAARQLDFSRFFKAWDAGLITKARVGDEWRLVNRHTPLAQMAPAPSAKEPIVMRIDPQTLGLRFK
jgi:hypothetical protein